MNSRESNPTVILDWHTGWHHLRLSIEGYQFPGNTGQYDNEWLMILGDVSCPEGEWSFRDPCLMSTELGELGAFLSIDNPPATQAECYLTEPVLQFTRAAIDEVRVGFAQEATPLWAADDPEIRFGAGFPLRFFLSADDLARTSAMLREGARQFPPQGPRPPGGRG